MRMVPSKPTPKTRTDRNSERTMIRRTMIRRTKRLVELHLPGLPFNVLVRAIVQARGDILYP